MQLLVMRSTKSVRQRVLDAGRPIGFLECCQD
jgi:hypothetical protein